MESEKQEQLPETIDPKSGYCSRTKSFYSLRPKAPLPSLHQSLSISQHCFSFLNSSKTEAELSTIKALIDSKTGDYLLYSDFIRQVNSLTVSIRSQFPWLKQNDVAFILLPSSFHVAVIYFSLLSLGLVMCPANPQGSKSEVAHQLKLCKPKLAFATSATAHKLKSSTSTPSHQIMLVDSPEFESFLNFRGDTCMGEFPVVRQSDMGAILFSSGTTGKVKAVGLTHRNLIALISGFYHNNFELPTADPVSLFTLPLFHVYGFMMLLGAVAKGTTMALMERFDLEEMLRVVERYKVTFIPVAPPLVMSFVNSDLTNNYDLNSLILLGCGGAPLRKEIVHRFNHKFPNIHILEGYGMTETAGAGTRMISPEETKFRGSAGCLIEYMEAKIVDPDTGEALGPGQRGELWLRGPTVMIGYVGDEKATADTFDAAGWLKTGDLCYFDSNGFLYIVDRLKELIKYKAYQVPPAELEELLQSNPYVADAAVIPYPDEVAGQIPMAYIVRKPGSNITEAQAMEFVAKRVAPYKKIRRVSFVNAIPKSPAGKILRRELIAQLPTAASSRL